ncbi:hypothetical protein F5B18DRAFT_621607 [Nemania serpens]|nr:hypothetical protein F5B18DRAFT_621607 [Nemania serpens]
MPRNARIFPTWQYRSILVGWLARSHASCLATEVSCDYMRKPASVSRQKDTPATRQQNPFTWYQLGKCFVVGEWLHNSCDSLMMSDIENRSCKN